MQEQHRIEMNEMWDRFREDDDMICDAPARKIGMPYATAYGVLFPVEIDGELVFVDLDIDQVKRLAHGLLAALPEAKELATKAEADFLTHEVICKARGI